jgi:hypothetical protein
MAATGVSYRAGGSGPSCRVAGGWVAVIIGIIGGDRLGADIEVVMCSRTAIDLVWPRLKSSDWLDRRHSRSTCEMTAA